VAARIENAAARRLERAELRLTAAAERHRLLDPERVLERGYALARGADGRVVTAARGLAPGSALVVQFRDGRVGTRIEEIQSSTPEQSP
ncbi:MAG: exodeoxyribonuclease VII large subunit, partial [Planctomycetes bacterium]|nr:exodeoxyribonuclease VII large subunit [Planctomycetota bacterium]